MPHHNQSIGLAFSSPSNVPAFVNSVAEATLLLRVGAISAPVAVILDDVRMFYAIKLFKKDCLILTKEKLISLLSQGLAP